MWKKYPEKEPLQACSVYRQHAEHMNRNSDFPTFGVNALCVLTIF